MDSKVTEVQRQPPDQCLQGLRDQEVPGIHATADGPTRNLEAIWRSTCLSSRTWGHERCHHIPKLALGLNSVSLCMGCQDCTLLPYAVCSLQGYPWGSWWEVWGQTSPWMMYSSYWISTITMPRPWMLQIRSSFSYAWVKKRQLLDWGVCLSRHLQVLMASFPEHFPLDHHSWAEVWPFIWWTP